ncbi:DUF3526 domain-containing protein [Agaribacter marinus]|uniref:ABC transporter permease n=1 Tax=Agaribacter marinus TaxID=1431249 RepID=A0AA37SX75_9ALTE|nr:DUF3526 domain-containing protein [Agaribacter marinus]GLR71503.1 ABC transporter permease [Agaribacter marinus]
MMYSIAQIKREWQFMLSQRYVLALLLCGLLVSVFSVVTGISEVNQQRATIERLKAADEIDRAEAQEKYDDPGSLAYYTFHLTYASPSNLAFAALGERDIYPWKHRVRMLALEGQIYESDAQNPELAQIGKIDFVFVISALSPLIIILLFHDLVASERNNGRYDFIVSTAKSSFALWGARSAVRFISLYVCFMLPFVVGAVISDTAFIDVLLVSFMCFAYFIFWTLLSLWFGRHSSSAPKIASSLIGIWVLFAFVLPILGDIAINKHIESPDGGDILLVQREAVNDAWDLSIDTTMASFLAEHPEYDYYEELQSGGFNWWWYYAFQQVGDQTAGSLSVQYRHASVAKYESAKYVSWLSPPLLLQRSMTRIADTDAKAAFEYENQIREFHKALRMFYYPELFSSDTFDKNKLESMPQFK